MGVFPRQGELLTWELLAYMPSILLLENGQAVPSSLLLPVLLGFQQYHACLSLIMAGQKRHGNLMDVSLDLARASTLACHFCLYQAQGTNDTLRLQWGER